MTVDAAVPLRIPMQPQKWLFVMGLLIHPPMTVFCVWGIFGGDETWVRVGAGIGALLFGALAAYAVVAIKRTWGKTFEIVVDRDTLHVPNPVRGRVDHIALASIRSATIAVTPARVTEFRLLTIGFADGEKSRAIVVASQHVGNPAFDQLCGVLHSRGIPIG